jgi:quercetin dioxygenase-like cupin family protein
LGRREVDMKKFVVMAGLLALFAGLLVHAQDRTEHAGDMKHVIMRPDAVKWGPVPPSAPAGAQTAVLVGDPGKEGMPYVYWVKMPDGYKVPPHWHTMDENVTVLKGMLLVGMGEKLDPSKVEELSAGSFWYTPKSMRHYALAKGETVIQLHGIGPYGINYVNPADDPRKQKDKK